MEHTIRNWSLILGILSVVALILVSFLIVNPRSAEAASCGFYRDLHVGMIGEDVRCLQQYLYTDFLSPMGYTIEQTGSYGGQTAQAVMMWQQQNGIYPSTGTFGPLSRARYQATSLMSTGVSYGGTTQYIVQSEDEDEDDDDDNDRDRNRNAEDSIEDAFDEILEALNEIGLRRTNANHALASQELRNALDDLSDAVSEYFDGDEDEAEDRADDAKDNAEDAIAAAGGNISNNNNDNDEVEDDLDDAWDEWNDAWDEVEDADDDGDDTDDAEDLLDDAEELLQDAEDELDDDDEDEAEDLIEDALDLIDEALDEI